MSYIFEQNVGKHRYIYECSSYRNDNGEPRNKRVMIGKVNLKTGQKIYNDEYIERMANCGMPVDLGDDIKLFTISDVKKAIVRDFGLFYFLQNVSEKIGLLAILREAMPSFWNDVFGLACYLLASGEALMYCGDWVSRTECQGVGSLSSQRVSDLLAAIDESTRNRFYQLWCAYRQEREYLAIDITSASSYSELIDDVAWGRNRDGEALPQVNICMLMGEETRLPVYQRIYDGSLNDVKTLRSTIMSFGHITNGRDVLAVMDKGFYSSNNIDEMFDWPVHFIISAPLKTTMVKALVDAARDEIDTVDNVIVVGDDPMRAITRELEWGGRKMYAHIYYNAKKASNEKEDLYAQVSLLKDKTVKDPEKCAKSPAFRKYLRFVKSKRGYYVYYKKDVIDKELLYTGWVVLLSNAVSSKKRAIRIYRDKDVVEKGFDLFKNSLDMGRLRVHSEGRMFSKLFVGFVALIMMSHINYVMMEKGLYIKMTMRNLVHTLSALRVHYINGTKILFPVTKAQNDIFKAFDIDPPK